MRERSILTPSYEKEAYECVYTYMCQCGKVSEEKVTRGWILLSGAKQ